MQYYFDGVERLQWGFHTPNVAAGFAVVATFLFIAACAWFSGRRSRLASCGGTFICAACAMLCEGYIAMTYSRGGYVALVAGLAFILIAALARIRKYPTDETGRHLRNMTACLVAFFIICLLTVPHGIHRLSTISKMSDAAISHRVETWKGGTRIATENWANGTGDVMYAPWYYTNFLQPGTINEEYYSLISDPITAAAYFGFAKVFLVFTAALLFPFSGLLLWLKYGDDVILCLTGGIGAYMTAGVFNSLLPNDRMTCILSILYAAALLRILWLLWKNGPVAGIWKPFVLSGGGALLLCSMIYGTGLSQIANKPWDVEFCQGSDFRNFKVACFIPNGQATKTIVYIAENPFGGNCHVQRRWVAEGIEVISVASKQEIGSIDDMLTLWEKFCLGKRKSEIEVIVCGQMQSNAVFAALYKLPREQRPNQLICHGLDVRRLSEDSGLTLDDIGIPCKILPPTDALD